MVLIAGWNSYDAAIIELEEVLEFNDKVQPICLPNQFYHEAAAEHKLKAYIAGWGLTTAHDIWDQNGRRVAANESDIPIHEEILREGYVDFMPLQALVDAFQSLAEREVDRTNYTTLRWELRQQAYELLQEARADPVAWTPVEFLKMKRRVPDWVVTNIKNYSTFVQEGLARVYYSLHDSNETEFREKAARSLALKKNLYERVFAQNRNGIIAVNGTDTTAHVESGDSGGPLMIELDKGRWFQVGIAQSLVHRWRQDPQNPNVYTAVAPLCEWIEETTNWEVRCQDWPKDHWPGDGEKFGKI